MMSCESDTTHSPPDHRSVLLCLATPITATSFQLTDVRLVSESAVITVHGLGEIGMNNTPFQTHCTMV